MAAPLPLQILTSQHLKNVNSENIADAVKYFSGVLVKDYGGAGGLKTVSVRSLGANHTGVLYDGVVLGDAQAGQIDLGRYALDNVYSVALQNAQPGEILNTARAFAAASVIQIKTLALADSVKNHFSAGVKTGSFGLWNPSLLAGLRINNKWAAQVNGSYITSKNNYSFIDYENNSQTQKRTNSDINAFNGEADLVCDLKNKTRFNFKTYYYSSERGLPGSVILYNHFSNERLADKNFFVQSSYKTFLGNKDELLFNTKYTYLFNHYLRPASAATGSNYENIFHQKELYGSAVWKHKFAPWMEAAYAGDFFHTTLSRTDAFALNEYFAFPTRNTLLQNLAVKALLRNVEAQASLLYTNMTNSVKNGNTAKNFANWSPTLSIVVQPLPYIPLRVRAFYKNIFRPPTFNDLYYTIIGNTMLRPETANQYNLGVAYILPATGLFQKIAITVDAYHNNVKDKIVAVPRENLFQWSMQNLGSVKINGVDATLAADFEELRKWKISTNINYSFQQALDMTDASSPLYKNQIAYTPQHSGSLRLAAMHNRFSAGYNVLFSGYRYRIGEILKDNYLPGWAIHDVNLRYAIAAGKTKYTLFMEANNIFNKQYEIVMYYPMPRRNWRLGASVTF